MTTYTAPRVDPQKLWPILPFGFDRGVSTESDALVSVSADGVDLNYDLGTGRCCHHGLEC